MCALFAKPSTTDSPPPPREVYRRGVVSAGSNAVHIPGYRVLRTIGKGATASAYLAEALDRPGPLVLKVLHGHAADDPAATTATLVAGPAGGPERLRLEASLLTALDHPHIVRVLDAGEHAGVGYIAMEYLEGGDLEARLVHGIGVLEALDVARAVAAGLGYAHARGVIHRDVKPQNILFRRDGTAVLSDFGVAKRLDDDLKLTREGVSVGSPLYMSPEQAKGEAVDGRSDIYSLGVILFEMLAGQPPFDAPSSLAVILKHIHGEIPRLPANRQGFQALVDLLLAKDPADRVDSAERLVPLLAEYRQRVATAGMDVVRGDAGVAEAFPATLLEHLRAGIQEDLAYDRLILPSLPEVAMRVREAVAGDSPVREVARLIAVDPALSAQVMKVANSAFYPGRNPVTELKGAVVRLGGNAVRHLVMALVAAQLFQAKQARELESRIRAEWEHSVLVAALARTLAEERPGLEPDVALLAGLIHRIGVLPVLDWAVKIPHLAEHPGRLDAFVEHCHADIGVLILTRWNYPELFVRVVERQGDDVPAPADGPDYPGVVALAHRLATDHPDATDEERLAAADYGLGGEPLAADAVAALLARGRAGAAELLSVLRY